MYLSMNYIKKMGDLMAEDKRFIVFTVRLNPKVRRLLRVQAASKELTMQQYIEML